MNYKNFETEIKDEVLFVYFDSPGKSVNTFDRSSMDELNDILGNINGDHKGIVFASRKTSFIAGADVKELVAVSQESDDAIIEVVKSGQEVFNKIEDMPIPTLAWINGTAMGGGLEIALACTGRIAEPQAQVALPEVKLGILPAWGGTTRLPRLIGADNAIDIICSGRTLRAKEALKMGLVDAIAEKDANFEEVAVETINGLRNEIEKRRKKKISPIKLGMIESMMTFKFAKVTVSKKAGSNYPAPIKALEVIETCRKMERDEALTYEQTAFVELSKTDVSKNLINIFFGERKLKSKAASYAGSTPPIKKVAVLGAGAMGSGIAFGIANKANVKVSIFDPYDNQIEKSIKSNRDYLMNKVSKGYITISECNRVMDLIKGTTNLEEAVIDADVVIEAVPEDIRLKKSVLRESASYATAETVFATNTSTFKVDDLKEGLNATRVGGMHFFNPVSKMPLVEIVKGEDTSDGTVGTLCSLALAMGKTPLVCNDCAGFVVNRVLMPYLVEFDHMISSGIDFEHIDKVMKDFGWPMGPAELADLVGIDVMVHASNSMVEEYDYIKSPENSFCKQLYENNTLGQKTGAGFYSWKETKRKGKFSDSGDKKPSPADVEKRLMSVMTEEAKTILNEKIVDEPYEINMAMIFGTGYPPYKEGLV